jgi:hypothetical protein
MTVQQVQQVQRWTSWTAGTGVQLVHQVHNRHRTVVLDWTSWTDQTSGRRSVGLSDHHWPHVTAGWLLLSCLIATPHFPAASQPLGLTVTLTPASILDSRAVVPRWCPND